MIQHYQPNWKVIFGALLGLLMVTSYAQAEDIYDYYDSGYIFALKSNSISLTEGFTTYSPTVKVFKLNGEKGSVSDLKVGDYVKLTVLVMDNKRRVDTIRYLPDPKTGKK